VSENQSSELLNTRELARLLYAFKYSFPIFDVGVVVFDSRVEDVIEAVLPHKNMGEDSYAFEDRVIKILETPHQLQIVNRVHLLFVLFDVV
jgi:hypothetical protein